MKNGLVTTDPGANPEGAQPDPAAAPTGDVAARIGEFDRLFKDHSPRFAGLIGQIRTGPRRSETLEAAIQRWERGELANPVTAADSVAANLVHAGLVEAALREGNDRIVIDGEIDRKGCGGVACRAITAIWEADHNGARFLSAYGLPLLPADLESIEKVVVIGHIPAQ